jgi:hypothetical protein
MNRRIPTSHNSAGNRTSEAGRQTRVETDFETMPDHENSPLQFSAKFYSDEHQISSRTSQSKWR